MKEITLYIPPSGEDYAGHSIFVTSSTSTSDLGIFYLSEEKLSHSYVQAGEEESEEDLADRLKFYENQ